MLNKKIIFIAVGVIVAAIIVFVTVSFIFQNGSGGRTTTPAAGGELDTTQIVPLVNAPKGDTLSIGTARGSVTMKNFYASALGATEQFVIIKRTDAYELNYDTYTSGFSIIIIKAPMEQNRATAEAAFLDVLDISKSDACKLNVWVGSSIDNNSGQNLHLSFCGSVL